jgi:hypothetical protein
MAATYADSAPRPGVGILYSRSDVGRPAGASARRSCDNVTSRVFSRSLWSGASPWRDWKRRDRRVITDAAAHRGHTDGSRRMGGKCAMPADRYLMARLPAPGARRRGFGTARLWRRAFDWAPNYAFIVPGRPWLCFEPIRKRTFRVSGSSGAWEMRPCPTGSRSRV